MFFGPQRQSTFGFPLIATPDGHLQRYLHPLEAGTRPSPCDQPAFVKNGLLVYSLFAMSVAMHVARPEICQVDYLLMLPHPLDNPAEPNVAFLHNLSINLGGTCTRDT